MWWRRSARSALTTIMSIASNLTETSFSGEGKAPPLGRQALELLALGRARGVGRGATCGV